MGQVIRAVPSQSGIGALLPKHYSVDCENFKMFWIIKILTRLFESKLLILTLSCIVAMVACRTTRVLALCISVITYGINCIRKIDSCIILNTLTKDLPP